MATKKMTISMPKELYDRAERFKDQRNWSAIARRSIEQEVRICEAIADKDRAAALRAKAQADCTDVEAAGFDDALTYPIEEIDYRFLREFEERACGYIESVDPENVIAVFDELRRSYRKEDGTVAFRLRFQSWEYKQGFINGILKLKRIADGIEE